MKLFAGVARQISSLAKSGMKGLTREERARIDLAAAFRLAVRMNWHDGVYSHFSLAVSDDGKQFLMNPLW